MFSIILAFLISFIGLLLLLNRGAILLWWPKQQNINDQRTLPGPKPFPIIGNLNLLGTLPHCALYNLAQKYGPIMSIKLGQVHGIVVSSPEAAEQFLKIHDINFASRPTIQASKIVAYGITGLIFQKYGSYWRNVRKICTLQLLSGSKIEKFTPVRKEEVKLLVEEIKKAALAGEVVDLSKRVAGVVENMTYRMVLGRRNDDELYLKALIEEVAFLAVHESLDKVFEKIISEHEKDRQPRQYRDFVDTLLSMLNQPMNPNEEPLHMIDRTTIKAIMFDMVVPALDTTTNVISWTLSEIFKHQHVMSRLQEELHCVIGNKREVEEKDLDKLPYLDMVIKESLRLHPVLALLVPHESIADIIIDGYYIPKKSRIIVNVWAIGHDPNVWSENVNEFYPERFLDSDMDVRGRDFQLIPFSSGRRSCPGMQLGMNMVKLVVAQLLHCFNWRLPDGMLPEEIDMSEHFGITLSRKKHLFGIPTYRLSV
ncbi:hypothetical protein ACFE04_031809 [Oxalis oulophora]